MKEKTRQAGFPWLTSLIVVALIGIAVATVYLAQKSRALLQTHLTGQRLAILPVLGLEAAGEQWQRWGIPSLVTEHFSLVPDVEMLDTDAFRRNLVLRGLDGPSEPQRVATRRLAVAMGARFLVEAELVGRGKDLRVTLRVYDAAGAVVEETSLEPTGTEPLAWAQTLVDALYSVATHGLKAKPLHEVIAQDPVVARIYAEGVHLWLQAGGTDPQRAAVARPYFEIALRNEPKSLRAKWRLMLIEREIGRRDVAAAMARELVEKTGLQGETELNLQALRMQGLIEAIEGNPRSADHFFTLAYRAALSRNKRASQIDALGDQVRLALGAGGANTERAEELLVETLEVQRAVGDRLGESDSLLNLGLLALRHGDLENAARLVGDAVKLMEEIGDQWGAQRSATTLAELLWRRGESDAAIALWKKSLDYHRTQKDSPRILLVSESLGQALIDRRLWGDAEKVFQDLRELARTERDLVTETKAAAALAWLCLRRGYRRQAEEPLTFALEHRGQLSDPARLDRAKAWMAYEEGRFGEAYRAWSQLRNRTPWSAEDEEFLKAFAAALASGRRQSLPGESSSPGPISSF